MENPKISIIIPVYNVENYIYKCLDSICNQTFRDFEVIMINDGSSDNSGNICDEYVIKDSRFTVFHNCNQGSGPARNIGIDKSRGKYLMFIDPDDWIDIDMFEVMYNLIENKNLDLVICPDRNYYMDNENIIRIDEPKSNYRICEDKQAVREIFTELCTNSLSHAPHNKIYKSSLIKRNSLYFPAIRRSQDIVFNNRYFEVINSLAITEKCYYNYRVNNLEAQAKKIPSNMFNIYTMLFEDYIDMHIKWGILNSEKENMLVSAYLTNICYCIYNLYNPNIKRSFRDKYKYIKEISNNKKVRDNIKKSKNTSIFIKIILKCIKFKQILAIMLLYKIKFSIRKLVSILK